MFELYLKEHQSLQRIYHSKMLMKRRIYRQYTSLEVDQLRQKLKQYSDYDEIKRELEIMKVRDIAVLLARLTDGEDSMSNSLDSTTQKT